MLELIARGSSLGFAAASIPGPLHTYIMNETLLYGWRHSLIIAFSPLITDIPVIILIVFILGQLPDSAIPALQIVGGIYILYLAYNTWQQSRQPIDMQAEINTSQRQTLSRAMLMNWLNPNPYFFWATINGPLLLRGLENSPAHGMAFLLAFYGVFITLLIGVVFIFNRVRRLDARFIRILLRIAVVVLIIFGGSMLMQAAGNIF